MKKDKKKVLMLIDHLGVGGAQEIVHDLCKLVDDRYDCSVAYIFKKSDYRVKLEAFNTKVFSLGVSNNYTKLNSMNPIPLFRLIWLVHKEKYDIIHLHLYIVSFLAIFIKILFPNIKIINTIHTTKDMFPEPIYKVYGISKFFTDIFVAEYDSTENDLKEIGVKSNKIHRINFGSNIVDNFDYQMEFKDLHEELSISKNDKVLMSIARLGVDRRIDMFIEAMPDILNKVPETKLVIVGDGPEETKLKKLVKEKGIRESVIFTGYRNDLPDLFNLCDVYLTIFEDSSPISIAAIQIWMYSKPIAGFNIGHKKLEEIRLKTPFLTVTKDKKILAKELIDLISDQKKLEDFGEQSRLYVTQNYSLKRMINKYNNLYRSLIN